MSFDSFGSRRNVNWVSSVLNTPPITLVAITDKGYTGHEQLDDVGLIHMNGRVYDPLMGRFLSADPNIQAPTDTQSLNRYAYVLNNPLSATDPSGYFFKKLLQKISSNPLLNAIASYYLGPLYAAAVTAANGGSFGDILKSYVIASAAQAAFQAYGAGDGFAGFVSRGAIGGVVNVTSGGKFGQGFMSAGLGGLYGGDDIFVSAIIGGTISRATGGKFANGAASAGFAAAMRSGGSDRNFNREGDDPPLLADLTEDQKIEIQKRLDIINKSAEIRIADDSKGVARWLGKQIGSLSKEFGIEFGTEIITINGGAGFHLVDTQFKTNAVEYLKVDGIASWHNHPTKGIASSTDFIASFDNNRDSFISLSNGKIQQIHYTQISLAYKKIGQQFLNDGYNDPKTFLPRMNQWIEAQSVFYIDKYSTYF
ncbi:MAG TPA: RHS repeat-associated core domain-containing protein [Aeromonadales bacterium]|nr:RHS repeat-associated core domain-containing protein [Aeromonadales bacterium]